MGHPVYTVAAHLRAVISRWFRAANLVESRDLLSDSLVKKSEVGLLDAALKCAATVIKSGVCLSWLKCTNAN